MKRFTCRVCSFKARTFGEIEAHIRRKHKRKKIRVKR